MQYLLCFFFHFHFSFCRSPKQYQNRIERKAVEKKSGDGDLFLIDGWLVSFHWETSSLRAHVYFRMGGSRGGTRLQLIFCYMIIALKSFIVPLGWLNWIEKKKKNWKSGFEVSDIQSSDFGARHKKKYCGAEQWHYNVEWKIYHRLSCCIKFINFQKKKIWYWIENESFLHTHSIQFHF